MTSHKSLSMVASRRRGQRVHIQQCVPFRKRKTCWDKPFSLSFRMLPTEASLLSLEHICLNVILNTIHLCRPAFKWKSVGYLQQACKYRTQLKEFKDEPKNVILISSQSLGLWRRTSSIHLNARQSWELPAKYTGIFKSFNKWTCSRPS